MLGFWIFMFCINLLIPLSMILLGKRFLKAPPREINFLFGYRTTMSMKNADTWAYAHRYFGKWWWILGLLLLPLSTIPMLFVRTGSADQIGWVGGGICVLQMLAMLWPIVPTERTLRKAFDPDGNPKKKDGCI